MGDGEKEGRRGPQGRQAKDSLLSLFFALLLAWPCGTELTTQSRGVAVTEGGWERGGDGFPEEAMFKLDSICQICPGGRPRCVRGQERSQAGGKSRAGVGAEPAGSLS